MKIRNQVLLVMVGLLVLVTVGFTVLLGRTQRRALESGIDGELRAAAFMARDILPPGYHDRITGKDSVSDAEYMRIVDNFNRICVEANLEYLWSVMILDGKVVFTSATSPGKKAANRDHAAFLEVHSNPELYLRAFETMRPQFQINEDKWGRTRAVLLPFRDANGRPYLMGAARSMQQVDKQLHATLMSSLLAGGIVLLVGALVCLVLANSLARPVEAVTAAAAKMAAGDLSQAVTVSGARELEMLGESINSMSRAIRERISMLSTVLNSVPQSIFWKDDKGRFLGCNEVFAKAIGFDRPESVVGKTDFDCPASKEQAEAYLADDQEVMRTGQAKRHIVEPFLQANGSSLWIDTTKVPLLGADGKVCGVLGVYEDITERKQAQEALEGVLSRARCILWDARLDYTDSRRNWNIQMRCPEKLRQDFGLNPGPDEDVAAMWLRVLSVDPEQRQRMYKTCDIALQAGARSYAQEYWIRAADGSKRWLSETVDVTPLSPGKWHLVGVVVEVTAVKLADESLFAERTTLRTVIDNLPDQVFMKDRQSRFILCNPSVARALSIAKGLSETVSCNSILGKTDADFLPAAVAQTHFAEEQELMRSGQPMINAEGGGIGPDGQPYWFLSTKIPLFDRERNVTGLLGINRDISEHKRLEEQLRQAQKMDAIGKLAGGIAHDFNNQLTSVMGYADILANRLQDETFRRYARNILKASQRAADLTQQLLAFARKGKYISTPVDVHIVIAEVVSLLKHSIDKRIEIIQRLDASPSTTQGDPTQLQNALLNLAINARDAMPNGGQIFFTTSVVGLLDGALGQAIAAGRYLAISVMDTGMGMDAATQKHLFEPFFTTKEVGKGTGLGLAAVYGTVRNHHGAVTVDSEVGHGTTFKIYLPLVEGAPAAKSGAAAAQVLSTTRGQARILVVDDEEAVRDAAADMLRELGYEVVIRNDGDDALSYYAESWRNIDLVILDMVMPKKGGRETFHAMRAINPAVKVLLASGYSIDGDAQGILDEGVLAFLQKPFQTAELSQKLAAALGE